MYFHIGMNVFLRKERIIGIFPGTMLSQTPEEQPFLRDAKMVDHHVALTQAKTCILTDANELHVSNVGCRTLRQRWKIPEM